MVYKTFKNKYIQSSRNAFKINKSIIMYQKVNKLGFCLNNVYQQFVRFEKS